MHIQLNDQYRLYGHSYGYSIQRKETSPNKEGGIQWSSFLHYTNLSTAITGYADYRFRTADTENLESALATIEGVSPADVDIVRLRSILSSQDVLLEPVLDIPQGFDSQ